mmetsp:Transcript_45255/g.119410  ORF Transcript_45255/g.119410 Transcript_45255/m.119410 type:complete len:227 (+) Transcript_45255:1122-1802(+)
MAQGRSAPTASRGAQWTSSVRGRPITRTDSESSTAASQLRSMPARLTEHVTSLLHAPAACCPPLHSVGDHELRHVRADRYAVRRIPLQAEGTRGAQELTRGCKAFLALQCAGSVVRSIRTMGMAGCCPVRRVHGKHLEARRLRATHRDTRCGTRHDAQVAGDLALRGEPESALRHARRPARDALAPSGSVLDQTRHVDRARQAHARCCVHGQNTCIALDEKIAGES